MSDHVTPRLTSALEGRRVLLLASALLLPLGCGDSTGPMLASVVVSPATVTLTAIGGTVQFTAVGRDLNGNAIVSGGFVWSSSNPQVATVGESSGLATAVANGITMISAGTPSLLSQSASATLTVAAP